MTRQRFRRGALAASAGAEAGIGTAVAGEKWTFGPDAWLSVGAGVRASYVHDKDADNEDDFTLDSARIITNGQFAKVVGFTFDTEIDSDGDINDIRMMDAILRLEFSDALNVYGGRMLAPSDRANLDRPYYLDDDAGRHRSQDAFGVGEIMGARPSAIYSE